MHYDMVNELLSNNNEKEVSYPINYVGKCKYTSSLKGITVAVNHAISLGLTPRLCTQEKKIMQFHSKREIRKELHFHILHKNHTI